VVTRAEIVERAAEWGMTEEVVEQDYVLGWLLWAIGTDPTLGQRWVFKGGTCVKKCYVETYRFCDDLEFTVLPGGPFRPCEVKPLLLRILSRITEASGIEFSTPCLLPGQGNVSYLGPCRAPRPARVDLALSADERVVRSPVAAKVAHPYPDTFPSEATIRCYSFDELFAELIRALAQRGRPRDLYDVINLFRRSDLRIYPEAIRSALHENCAANASEVPTAERLADSPLLVELEAEWEKTLGQQLPALPPLEPVLEELPILFAWIDGDVEEIESIAITYASDEDASWSPPPSVSTWGIGVPLETVRFAAANHLLVELAYQGRTLLVEPYSLRRTLAGALVLHAERADGSGHGSYPVDQIERLRATTTPFRPKLPIDFSAHGPLHTPPRYRTLTSSATRDPRATSSPTSTVFLYECTRCGREFAHARRNATLRRHNDPDGYRCRGRRGRYIGVSD
jgi:predicted nucleotidyltransferase component of viral defense system